MDQKRNLLMLTHMNLGNWSQKFMEQTVPQSQVNLVLFGALQDICRAIGWAEDQEQFWDDHEAAYTALYGEGE